VPHIQEAVERWRSTPTNVIVKCSLNPVGQRQDPLSSRLPRPEAQDSGAQIHVGEGKFRDVTNLRPRSIKHSAIA
jgi:hypothetical protein